MPLLYRYISPEELIQIREKLFVQTRWQGPDGERVTYFTPDVYDDADTAQARLALRHPPRFRVGPIAVTSLKGFRMGIVQPKYGHPGGGREYSTIDKVWLLSAWNLHEARWEEV